MKSDASAALFCFSEVVKCVACRSQTRANLLQDGEISDPFAGSSLPAEMKTALAKPLFHEGFRTPFLRSRGYFTTTVAISPDSRW
jgi:hypothetical protein